jgi:hypothetical protein
VLVFQVIVPVLFVYFCDRAAEAWYTNSLKRQQQRQGARRSSADGSAGASDTATGGGPSPTASSAAAGSSREGAWAAESTGDQFEFGQQQQQQVLHGYCKPANAQPSAALVMLFGLGLAGVLFDVVLTVHTRLAPAELS